MGKLHLSHLVIHDNLKLPITRESVLNLFKKKTSKSPSESLNNIGAGLSSCHKNCSAKDLNNMDKYNDVGVSQTFSDDSGIHLTAAKEDIIEIDHLESPENLSDDESIEESALETDIKSFTEGYDLYKLALADDIDSDKQLLNGEEDGLNMKSLNLACSSHQACNNIEFFKHQVAGHTSSSDKPEGMVKGEKGTVLKLITKEECGEREIEFYEKLYDTNDVNLIELRELVPRYFGTKKISLNDKEYKCIILEDLTKDYKEPCVIDIKIGRRTWDPTASKEKILREEKKFENCKRDLGFCIPGFQVYKLEDNRFQKFGKDYGKSLDKDSARKAIKTFLNGNENGFCRDLIVQILGTLWRVQFWARRQRRIRLFASSILIVYDARRLKECLRIQDDSYSLPKLKLTRSKSLYRPLSVSILYHGQERINTGFSGQLTKEGPILQTRSFPSKIKELAVPSFHSKNNTWKKSMNALKRTHSFQNDYDKEVRDKKQDYTYLLDELVCEQKPELWVTVKMIDFAHVFPSENCDIDKNYLEGINNLVKMFEEFLAECE